jgi:hypothetical protein
MIEVCAIIIQDITLYSSDSEQLWFRIIPLNRRSRGITIASQVRPKRTKIYSTESHQYSCINFQRGLNATGWKVANSSA